MPPSSQRRTLLNRFAPIGRLMRGIQIISYQDPPGGIEEHRLLGLASWPRTSFSFGAAFYGWPYLFGAASVIQDHGWISPDARLYGASSGAMTAALLACGVSLRHEALEAALQISETHISGHSSAFFHPKSIRKSFSSLATLFPADAHKKASSKLFIIVCQLPRFRKRIISHFPTRKALIDTLMASMAVPGHGVWTAHKTQAANLGWCVDGALVQNFGIDDRSQWSTVRIGVWRSRAAIRPWPVRLEIQPSKPMPLKMYLHVLNLRQRLAWYRLGEQDALQYTCRFQRRRIQSAPRGKRPLSAEVALQLEREPSTPPVIDSVLHKTDQEHSSLIR